MLVLTLWSVYVSSGRVTSSGLFSEFFWNVREPMIWFLHARLYVVLCSTIITSFAANLNEFNSFSCSFTSTFSMSIVIASSSSTDGRSSEPSTPVPTTAPVRRGQPRQAASRYRGPVPLQESSVLADSTPGLLEADESVPPEAVANTTQVEESVTPASPTLGESSQPAGTMLPSNLGPDSSLSAQTTRNQHVSTSMSHTAGSPTIPSTTSTAPQQPPGTQAMGKARSRSQSTPKSSAKTRSVPGKRPTAGLGTGTSQQTPPSTAAPSAKASNNTPQQHHQRTLPTAVAQITPTPGSTDQHLQGTTVPSAAPSANASGGTLQQRQHAASTAVGETTTTPDSTAVRSQGIAPPSATPSVNASGCIPANHQHASSTGGAQVPTTPDSMRRHLMDTSSTLVAPSAHTTEDTSRTARVVPSTSGIQPSYSASKDSQRPPITPSAVERGLRSLSISDQRQPSGANSTLLASQLAQPLDAQPRQERQASHSNTCDDSMDSHNNESTSTSEHGSRASPTHSESNTERELRSRACAAMGIDPSHASNRDSHSNVHHDTDQLDLTSDPGYQQAHHSTTSASRKGDTSSEPPIQPDTVRSLVAGRGQEAPPTSVTPSAHTSEGTPRGLQNILLRLGGGTTLFHSRQYSSSGSRYSVYSGDA